MAAGQIRAPMIIPLRDPQNFRSKSLTSDTKIEIISESGDTDIYFTINGMKPEIIRKLDQYTYKYTTPFNLPPGKRTVKAIAVSKCGNRESNVITKEFQVQEGLEKPQEKIADDSYGFLEELRRPSEDSMNYKHKAVPAPRRNKNSELVITKDNHMDTEKPMLYDPSGAPSFNRPSLTDFNSSLKLHREVDFLKCSYCLAPRSLDNKAKFCLSCGQALLPLPASRLPPPESGQLGVCIQCKSAVPMNVSNCLVCEASLDLQNQPQASLNLQKHIICSECDTTNPPNVEFCLTCESNLLEKGNPIAIRETFKPPVPMSNKNEGILKKCFNCSRQNNLCARYCDWCGSKQFDPHTDPHNTTMNRHTTLITCWKCHANNGLEACYCCQCGEKVIPPTRSDLTSINPSQTMVYSGSALTNGYIPNSSLRAGDTGSGYIHLPLKQTQYVMDKPRTVEKETQTVGLFYPSSTKIRAVEQISARDLSRNNACDKTGPISVVSPGKGFWRKQIDHIIAHLKAHASNNAEFQALIGEPRMGKLISANMHEEDYELNLTLTFSLKGYKDPYLREISETFEKKYLSSMLKRSGSMDSFHSDNTLRSNVHSQTNRKYRPEKKKIISRPSSAKTTNDPTKDLLREIGKGGEGNESKVIEYIEAGADFKSKSKKGTPFPNIAVKNKHFDAAITMIKNGANINNVDNEMGNTAFHELVLLGNYYNDKIVQFLDMGADPKIKNNKGETVLDVAERVKNQTAINMIIAKLGKSDVKNIIKPRLMDTEDL